MTYRLCIPLGTMLLSSLSDMFVSVCCSLSFFHYLMHLVPCSFFFFFFNDPAPPEIYPLPLHDALPIWTRPICGCRNPRQRRRGPACPREPPGTGGTSDGGLRGGRRGGPASRNGPRGARGRGRSRARYALRWSGRRLPCRPAPRSRCRGPPG